MSRRHPFVELFLARIREFLREPEVVFWVFGFPILLAIGLGIAFRNKAPDEIAVGVLEAPGADDAIRALAPELGFVVERVTAEQAEQRLRLGKVSLVVAPGGASSSSGAVVPDAAGGGAGGIPGADLRPGRSYEYRFDPTRPDSVHARQRVDDALQRAAGRIDPVLARETLVTEPGARYIDFLIPGLLGMNIMSGGMWGVGFVIVDMRSRKLLKRLLATPMRRSHFLAAMMASRMLLVFIEMFLLLAFGYFAFDMVLQGPVWQVALLSILGAFVFSGLGLLTASKARKIETVSGLMNLVMLPMFVLSGIFFSAERFPAAIQPFVKALPLTALNDALRAVILEGADLPSQLGRIAILLAWGAASYFLALKMFRWT